MNAACRIALVMILGLLTACASGRGTAVKPSPRAESGGYYKVGKPYQIKDKWYYPEENYTYDETGIASWYGDDFHSFQTANGETYNKNELTAAHATLPMPSLARVTNLDNGRAIVVRINDRGPFSGARIIDVSQRAAQLLGFEQKGTAKVRVQVLADESRAIAEAMRTYGQDPSPQMQQQAQAQPATMAEAPFSSAAVQRVEATPLAPPPAASRVAPSQQGLTAPTAQVAPGKKLSLADVHPVADYMEVPVSGKNDIYIQAGAFTQPENAHKLRTSLSKLAHAHIAEATVKGVHYYRVRLGPIASVTDADKLLKRVLGSGVNSARIVVD